jgi:hypothetical protein
VDWLVDAARDVREEVLPAGDDPFFARLLDYASEDAYLANRT